MSKTMGRWQHDDRDDALDEEADDEEELEGEWELDPNDPSHPDHDLSESAGYAGWDPALKPWLARRGVILLVALIVLAAFFVPILLRITP